MFESTNIKMVENIISTLETAKKSFEEQLNAIDEEFKKKLEEAKASLTASLEETETQLSYWYSLTKEQPTTEKKTRKRATKETLAEVGANTATAKPTEEKEEAEPVIVDTLFEENNAPVEAEVDETEAETEVEAEAEVSEDVEETVESDAVSEEDFFGAVEEAKAEESVSTVGEDEWPSTPQEW